MGLFSKDVEGSLLLQELSLQTVATCRGRQILPRKSGTHVAGCRGVMAESAAGAQASPHACKHTSAGQSYARANTYTCTHWPNATEVHKLSNKLNSWMTKTTKQAD